MQHLNEETLVAHYYHDDDAPPAAEEHLRVCGACRAQCETIRRVLALVDEAPVPDRGEQYGEQVWNRLRWKLGRERRTGVRWQTLAAAAALVAIAFFGGQLWHARNTAPSQGPLPAGGDRVAEARVRGAGGDAATSPDRILLVVVGDHLDMSERMLVELANADPKKSLDISSQQRRAVDLVASNRIYRQTAAQRGDERIASVLSDLEPVLVELSHAGSSLTPEEVSALQKRIDAKGLLFKVRVVSAQGGRAEQQRTAPIDSNSL
ncbi:MAG TPA: hypothetical protein VGR02_00055 [Thermoanaerobaculia bacterium]|jgi:hypothetical protein|nr:hypothetical protein [Thermoanaerobaculia bacterium]